MHCAIREVSVVRTQPPASDVLGDTRRTTDLHAFKQVYISYLRNSVLGALVNIASLPHGGVSLKARKRRECAIRQEMFRGLRVFLGGGSQKPRRLYDIRYG